MKNLTDSKLIKNGYVYCINIDGVKEYYVKFGPTYSVKLVQFDEDELYVKRTEDLLYYGKVEAIYKSDSTKLVAKEENKEC